MSIQMGLLMRIAHDIKTSNKLRLTNNIGALQHTQERVVYPT